MEFKVRPGQAQDTNAIAAILQELDWFSHYGGITPVQVSRHLELCLADDSHAVYMAETPAGDIVGYGAVHWLPTLFMPGPEGFVSELFVSASARGQGVGAQLLAAIRTEAEKRGCTRLSVINIRHRESYRRSFYAKQGWQEREAAANFILRLDETE